MLSLSLLLPLLQLLYGPAAVEASPASGFKLAEKLHAAPNGWTQGPRANPESLVHLKLAVRARDPSLLHRSVLEVSTPGHARYGKHLKREEIAALVEPEQGVSEDILSWLRQGGVASRDINNKGDWIDFSTTVEKAERLLNTHFFHFEDQSSKIRKIRTLQYSVPAKIAKHVRTVQPTIYFGQIQQHASHVIKDAKANKQQFPTNTPEILKKLYKMEGFKATQKYNNLLGVSGYLEEYARYDDLALFLQKFAPEQVGESFNVELIHGGLMNQTATSDSIEANLDIQYTVGLTFNTSITFYSTGGRGPLIPDLLEPDPEKNMDEPYMDQINYFAQLPDEKLPRVLSTSYGDNEQEVPKSFAEAVCDGFAKLGARGVTVLFSSGDDGAGAGCESNDGSKRPMFIPTFPAACPYVTSVGATGGHDPEIAVDFSAGGFSNVFPRPQYQEAVVGKYLEKLGTKFEQNFNKNGRGFPDISAQGVEFAVYDKGKQIPVFGTSCSCPTVASVISNLNYARLSKGMPVLGFINPWLYSRGFSGFTDIVNGTSTGCDGSKGGPVIPGAGWAAVPGWDPVTGFGTPNFQKLKELVTECKNA